MMRRASSTSSSCTDSRTSPRLSIVSGKMLRIAPDATTHGTPCASSRPRTTLASTSECVRKMTTRAEEDTEVNSPPRRKGGHGGISYLYSPFLRSSVVESLHSFCAHRVHHEQDHRHVVVLGGAGGKRFHVAKDTLAELLGRQVGVFLEQSRETRFAEAVVVGIHRFADPVGEQDVQISDMQRNRLLHQQPIEHFAVVELQAE